MADPAPVAAVAVEVKPVWKSKTFWANLLAGVAVYAGFLPPKIAAYAVPGVNILLRFITVGPISLTGN